MTNSEVRALKNTVAGWKSVKMSLEEENDFSSDYAANIIEDCISDLESFLQSFSKATGEHGES